MVSNLFIQISHILSQHKIISKDDVYICAYGLESFVISVLEIVSILVLSLFLNIFLNTLMFFFAFVPFRMYAGGYHADSKIKCYLIMLAVYAIFLLLIKNISNIYFTHSELIGMVFTFIVVLSFSPIVNGNKRVSQKEKIVYRKISFCIMFLEFAVIVGGIKIFPGSTVVFSIYLGQLAVSLSMIAAMIKNKIKEVEPNEEI